MALVAVLVAGGYALWWWTNGLRTFTAEAARRLAVHKEPLRLPDVRVQDSRGRRFGWDAYEGKWLLLDFIYTRCPTICSTLSRTFGSIASTVERIGIDDQVSLLSVSFDPSDTPEALRNYARVFSADGWTWRLAAVEDEAELRRVLERLGIIVIPNELGGYDHNAAIHLVNPDGLLVRIYGYDSHEKIVDDLKTLTSYGVPGTERDFVANAP